jgi:hypothetical protein
MTPEFNQWWNNDLLTEDNPFVDGTPAFWAWEGWCAAVKAERESIIGLADDLDYWDHSEKLIEAIKARGNK